MKNGPVSQAALVRRRCYSPSPLGAVLLLMATDRSLGLTLCSVPAALRFRNSPLGYIGGPWLAPLAAVVGAGHAAELPHSPSRTKAPALLREPN